MCESESFLYRPSEETYENAYVIMHPLIETTLGDI